MYILCSIFSPIKDTVVVNDRWGSGDACHHGGYYTCRDNYNPGVVQPRKWENCMTLDGSWGYRRDLRVDQVKSIESIIASIVETVRLVNICDFIIRFCHISA